MTEGNRTARLIVRLMERRDLEAARRLHNDDTTLLRLNDPVHVSEAQQEAWFAAMSTSAASRRYTVLEAGTGAFVGLFRVDQWDRVNRSVLVGMDVVAEMRGKGYARETYGYFLDYFFRQCGCHRLWLGVLDGNAPARTLYESLGFREEGRAREAIFRDGRFQDLVWMSLLAGEYRP